MTLINIISKVVKEFESQLKANCFFNNHLESLDLQGFESGLHDSTIQLYENLAETILQFFTKSKKHKEAVDVFSQTKSFGKRKERETEVQIMTGKKIKITNYYASKVPDSHQESRHTFHAMYRTILKASPMYCSIISMASVICPSFEMASQILQMQGTKADVNRVRNISIQTGKKCLQNRVGIQFKPEETLAGKTVVVSIDGGRSCIRENKDELNSQGTHNLFDANWREPKLFVIHIIDPKTGKQSKNDIPLYDCTFGTEEAFSLLEKYLTKLEIQKAEKVQFIADGAIWIWDRAKKMLLELGVKEDNIIETLDFYHGTEHLSAIIKNIPKRVNAQQKKTLYLELKDLLWNGKIEEIKEAVKKVIKRTNKNIRREFKYFTKHLKRCNYATFRSQGFLCGSGIIESGIRRIINLRFKCPSSFWYKENLEALIFLRATLLAKRWGFMITKLVEAEL